MARRRLLKAESDRDLWRAVGEHEKYMEAYCLCEVLELQLGALSKLASQERLRPTHSDASARVAAPHLGSGGVTRAETLHMVVEGAA